MTLGRQEVVDAALAILDQYGLADLSMRRLAEALGVKAGALYWHVENKQALLAAVADEVLAEVPRIDAQAGPAMALGAWCDGLRGALLAHRDSAELVATALSTGLCTHDPLRSPAALLDGTRPQRAARWGAQALLHLVLGHVMAEQNRELMARMGLAVAHPIRDDDGFHHATHALLRGLLDGADGPDLNRTE